jgi:multicomponent Na+:H+ antiporter subunit E
VTASEFVALFATWIALSGRHDPMFVLEGLVLCGLVTFLSRDVVYLIFEPHDETAETGITSLLLVVLRFAAYVPWLFYQIIIANFQVAYLVFHPRVPVDPHLLQFSTRLRGNIARVLLANSITLTPGTVTVRLEDGRYLVHALAPASVRAITEGKLQNKIAGIFMEAEEPPPAVEIAYSIEEVA